MKKLCGKIILCLVGAVVMSLGSGCISAGVYLLSGSSDADMPNYETAEFYLKQPAKRIIVEKKFDPPLNPAEIEKFVEDNLCKAIGVSASAVPVEGKDVKNAAKLVVYRFPQANWDAMRAHAEMPAMCVGMTFGAFEVFDPILLPFAIYQHILSYFGERYVSVFFDEQDKVIFAYGFDVFTGEVARPPAAAVDFLDTYKAWFSHCRWNGYGVAENADPKILRDKKFYLTDGTLCTIEPDKKEE